MDLAQLQLENAELLEILQSKNKKVNISINLVVNSRFENLHKILQNCLLAAVELRLIFGLWYFLGYRGKRCNI